MQQGRNMGKIYDYRACDKIWQRVSPELNPYPEIRAIPAMAELSLNAPPGEPTPITSVPSVSPPTSTTYTTTPAVVAPESPEDETTSALLGGIPNRCCMGTRASYELKVLEGFTYLENEGNRLDFLLAQRAPNRQIAKMMREYAIEERQRVREFMAIHYLITGECWCPNFPRQDTLPDDFCAALRLRYHVTVCDAYNYRRSAAQTLDSCLASILQRYSDNDYKQADKMLVALSQVL